jgi:hypothetical protein
VTITNGADVTAAVTLYATVEGIKPLLQLAKQIQLGAYRILTTDNPRADLSCHQGVRERLPTLMLFGQLRRTGKTHRDNSIPMQHAYGEELLQSTLVTAPYQNAKGICRVLGSDTLQDLVQRIARIAWVISVTQ